MRSLFVTGRATEVTPSRAVVFNHDPREVVSDGVTRPQNPARHSAVEGCPVLRTDVAGIAVGSDAHWVCAPSADGSQRETAVFTATTVQVKA